MVGNKLSISERNSLGNNVSRFKKLNIYFYTIILNRFITIIAYRDAVRLKYKKEKYRTRF